MSRKCKIILRPYCAGCILRIFEGEVEETCKGRKNTEKKAQELALYMARNFSFDVSKYGKLAWNVNRIAMCGKKDPSARLKMTANKWARELLKKEKKGGLMETMKLALAGNALDFAHIPPNEAFSKMKKTLHSKLDIDDRKRVLELIQKYKHITYVLDNTGEILFDKELIKQLVAMGKKVTIVVRSSPFLNDATLEDVKRLGLDKIADKVITFDSIGYKSVNGLAIAKGQAAFITMVDKQKPGIFILKVKCPVIASSLGVKEMASVVFVKE